MNTYKQHRFPLHIISYAVWLYYRFNLCHREVIPETNHVTGRRANNRVEQSHQATRVRERGMHKFKSIRQARRFVPAHATVQKPFNLGRYLVSANHYRDLRVIAFTEWNKAVA